MPSSSSTRSTACRPKSTSRPIEATVSRVRPVLMASLTTIVGMIPLVGDPMYGSMALTIMGGLTVGTIITLILLPLFYAAMFRIRKPQNA